MFGGKIERIRVSSDLFSYRKQFIRLNFGAPPFAGGERKWMRAPVERNSEREIYTGIDATSNGNHVDCLIN